MRLSICIIISLPIIMLSCNKSEVTNNSLSEMNLKGKVKSIKETEFEALDKIGQIEKGKEYLTKYYLFDEHGNKIEESKYWHGELREKHLFSYNEKHLLKETRKTFGISVADIDSKLRELNEVHNYEYHFDESGKIVYSVIKPGSYEATRYGLIGDSTIYVYNKNSNLIEERDYSANKSYYSFNNLVTVGDVSVSKYDENGLLQIWFYGSEVYQEAIEDNKPSEKKALITLGFEEPKLGSLIRFDTTMSKRYLYKDKTLMCKIRCN